MTRRFLVYVLAVLLVFNLSGCATQPPAGVSKANYVIADSTGDWGFPTPFGHYQRGPGYVRMSFIFDTLVWKDEQGFVPALAKKWEYDQATNSYIFELNDQVKWHDGSAFSAKDVKFTFDYFKQHPYAWIDTSKVKEVVVETEHRVRIQLLEPYAAFLNNVAGALPILPEHVWATVTDPANFQTEQALIGTGPFRLVDYRQAQGTYLYEANKNYYLGKPEVEQVKFVKLNNTMAVAALQRKEVNLITLQPDFRREVEQQGFHILEGRHDSITKLMFNHTRAPLADKRLRQALALVIDRDKVVEIGKRGFAEPGNPGLLSPDSDYMVNVEPYHADYQKAESILEELGYKRINGVFVKAGKPLELELLTRPLEARDGEVLQQQLQQFGLKIRLKTMEEKTVDSKVQNWDFDLAVLSHGGLGGDPEVLNRVIGGNGFISARFKQNQELNQLLKEQLTTTAPETRQAKTAQIQQLYAEELPALPLYYLDSYWADDGSIKLFFTKQGVGSGVPLPLNKLAFVRN